MLFGSAVRSAVSQTHRSACRACVFAVQPYAYKTDGCYWQYRIDNATQTRILDTALKLSCTYVPGQRSVSVCVGVADRLYSNA